MKYVALDELLKELRKEGFDIEDFPDRYVGNGWIRAHLENSCEGQGHGEILLRIPYSEGRVE